MYGKKDDDCLHVRIGRSKMINALGKGRDGFNCQGLMLLEKRGDEFHRQGLMLLVSGHTMVTEIVVDRGERSLSHY